MSQANPVFEGSLQRRDIARRRSETTARADMPGLSGGKVTNE